MDFSDLDTSLKVTAANVALYSAWLYVNRHFITSTPQSNRSSILTTNIGFAQSNPGAIVSFLKKTGLIDSSLAPSSLSKLVAQRHINYEELCLLHLAKESLFLNNASKVNALALLSKYIVYNPYQNIDLNVLRTYDISLSPVPGNVNNNTRTDYFSTLLEGTGLFTFVGARNNGIMQIKPGTLPIFRYLDYCQFADCTLPINSSDRFEYFASTKDGLFDHLLDSKPIIWDTYFPNLNGKILRTRSFHLQKIYFGTPGGGKSQKVKKLIEERSAEKRTFRTTFHPDTDYASFVGCYKPVMDGDKIKYEFVPQIFTNAYVAAWNDPQNDYYLVIEEINRGNCAQIFGDLFQLLDRNADGFSEYGIVADADLRKYLETAVDEDGNHILINKQGVHKGELRLPPNLSILATMNTSDQSLFPMDSAFKRRWDWEYVPSDDNNENDFTISFGKYTCRWHDLRNEINKRIFETTESEDKQLGAFFIKSDIGADELRSKVMFYLWSEVCKENYRTSDNFFRMRMDEGGNKEFSFNKLFEPGYIDTIKRWMDYLNINVS